MRLKLKLSGRGTQDIAAHRSRPDFRAEADHDLARRSATGVLSYFVLWLIIYFASNLEQANDTLLEFMGFMLAAISVGRLYLVWNFNALYAASALRWRWMFTIGVILSAMVWGGVNILALEFDRLGPTSLMVMLATAGIASGSIVSLAPAAWLGGIFIMIMLLPAVPFGMIAGNAAEKGVAMLFLVYFGVMFFLWRRLYVEYWSALAGRAELMIAKEAAEAATLAKGQFIASVSHELRTPLTAIIGALGIIESDLKNDMPDMAMKLTDMAFQNGKQLSVLIDDLLDFEKLNAGRMEFHPRHLEIPGFLEQVLEMNQSYAERHEVAFVLEQPLPEIGIRADEQRLTQVLTNLLSNAAKHSPAGEKVLVSAKLIEGGRVRIAVRDHGAGVPESFQKRIFEKFAQAENSNTNKTRGTGLGLAISKGIVEKMGGIIGFESIPGQGATFYFDLPVATAD